MTDMGIVKHMGVLVLSLVAFSAYGQKMSVSTNVLGYLNFGTLNAEVSYAPHRHWSLSAGARYNPFSFSRDGQPMRSIQQAYSIGTRFWPWHIYSGWWVGARLQYQEYSVGGILSPETEEGDRFGAGLSAGYTYMVHPHINLDFGIGFWAGYMSCIRYSCPVCGLTVGRGNGAFILPDNIIIGISYVF